jgi:FkbM family methyltransferase
MMHAEVMLRSLGVAIPADPGVITPAIESAILVDRYEAKEAAEIPAIVRPGDRVLEIGAGIGFISTLLARQPQVEKVVAVEANPNLLDYMGRLHAANGITKAERRNVVLSNSDAAEMTFYLRRDFWMGSLAEGPNPYYATVQVPTASLDQTIRDERITLIVCDIEGAETEIFDGADLGGVDRVYLELHDHVTGLTGVRHVFETMAGHGFAFDPRHSSGPIVLFRRADPGDALRPYAG